MEAPKIPDIVETPNHFWFGSVDLPFAIGNKEGTKVEPLCDGLVKVTKSFVAKSYSFKNDDSVYDFTKIERPKKR